MKPELLAPAGNMDKLKFAVAYGADAVYFGCEFGSLRNFAGNFDFDEADQAIDYLHARDKKAYVTLNIYPFSDEYQQITATAQKLDDMGVDAFIVADFGVLSTLKTLQVKAKIHISTQANTVSHQAAIAYQTLGASRVNLARELSFDRIQSIQTALGDRMETEVFIHGAVCFSYSGRCAISDYMTGFGANHGSCKHPCRWKYHLVEEKRPGEYLPVFEDDRGLYLFNPKDLALANYVQPLAELNITSLKIEGRMKSVHYVASIVSLYRRLLDGIDLTSSEIDTALKRVVNRGYSEGFMKGSFEPEDYLFDNNKPDIAAIFVGNILEARHNGRSIMEVRNKITSGETLELLSPDGTTCDITMADILTTTSGEQLAIANNTHHLILDDDLAPFSILRQIKTD